MHANELHLHYCNKAHDDEGLDYARTASCRWITIPQARQKTNSDSCSGKPWISKVRNYSNPFSEQFTAAEVLNLTDQVI